MDCQSHRNQKKIDISRASEKKDMLLSRNSNLRTSKVQDLNPIRGYFDNTQPN